MTITMSTAPTTPQTPQRSPLRSQQPRRRRKLRLTVRKMPRLSVRAHGPVCSTPLVPGTSQGSSPVPTTPHMPEGWEDLELSYVPGGVALCHERSKGKEPHRLSLPDAQCALCQIMSQLELEHRQKLGNPDRSPPRTPCQTEREHSTPPPAPVRPSRRRPRDEEEVAHPPDSYLIHVEVEQGLWDGQYDWEADIQ